MGRFFGITLSLFLLNIALCYSENPCCPEAAPPCECDGHIRGHVQVSFCGVPDVHIEDPREDYEWPGMNEDAFYDYFTK